MLGNSATSGAIHAVLAKGGDLVLENVTISGATSAGIRINNANSSVTATNVTISDCINGATMSAGELTLNGVSVSNTSDHGIIVSGGTMSMNGKVIADVYYEKADAVNVTDSLTDGSNVTVDWATDKVPTGNAIIFKDAQALIASKAYITLGSIMTGEGYVLNYNETTVTLVKE